MNVIIIVVLVLIIILVIYLASLYYNINYLIRDVAPLNIGNGKTNGSGTGTDAVMSSISAQVLDRPTSTRYHYSGWFFINTNFTPNGLDNILFNRGKDFIVSLNGSTLNITVNAVNSTVQTNAGSAVGTLKLGGSDKYLTSIPNFPFQKWAYLVINVDGQVVDVYIDGKFVLSTTNKVAIGSNGTNPITYGNQYTQGKVVRFSRPATVISPQGVWTDYMKGSGQSNSFSKTGVNVQFLKNGQTKVDQKIF